MTKEEKLEEINLVTFILEDDEVLQVMIEEVFRLNGIQNFKLFTNSTQLLQNDVIDICILDYYLGEKLDGMAVMKILRERNPDCYVIIMSGQTDCKVIKDFLNARADAYVDKNEPNYLSQLVQYVQIGLSATKRRKELNSLILKIKENVRS